jgi:hypothetical protein
MPSCSVLVGAVGIEKTDLSWNRHGGIEGARKDIKGNAQMRKGSRVKKNSRTISQATSGQHIPARKAN